MAGKKKKRGDGGSLPPRKTFLEKVAELTDLPSVTFSVTIRARCHPGTLSKVGFKFDWFTVDAKAGGDPVWAPVEGLPATLEGYEKNEAASDDKTEVQVSFTKSFSPVTSSLELCRALQHGVLNAHVFCNDQAAGTIPLSLAQLLLAYETPSPSRPPSPGGTEPEAWPLEYPTRVFTTRRDGLRVPGLFSVEIEAACDKPVLSDNLAKLLLPIYVEVKCAKDLPNEKWLPETSNGVYAYLYGDLSSTTKELQSEIGKKIRTPNGAAVCPHDKRVKLDAKMMFFLGPADNIHKAREWLMNDCLKVELHDRDPFGDESEQAADGNKKISPKVNAHGLASFRLADLLLPNNWDITLRADLHPIRGNVKQRYKELQMEGLDPATLLDRETREKVARLASTTELRETAPPYLSSGAFVQVRAIRRSPIPDWMDVQEEEEGDLARRLESIQVEEEQDDIYSAFDSVTEKTYYRYWVSEMDPNQKGGPTMRASKWHTEERAAENDKKGRTNVEFERKLRATNKMDVNKPVSDTGLDLRYERYGRHIVVLNIENEKVASDILRVVRDVNKKAVGLDGKPNSMLNAYQISEEQRKDPDFDIIGGVCLLDKRCRIFMLEGLRKGALQVLMDEIPRSDPNDDKNRFIFNNDVGYGERLYLDFNLSPKHIKIRQNLETLSGTKPELYDVTRVSPEIFEIIAQLRETKRAIRIEHCKKYLDCFPTSKTLTALEILYGDYISDQELEGKIPPVEKKKEKGAPAAGGAPPPQQTGGNKSPDRTQSAAHEEDQQTYVKMTRKLALNMANEQYETEKLRRSQSVPNLVRANRDAVQQTSLNNTLKREERDKDKPPKLADPATLFPEGTPIYLYSGQKYSSCELQKQEMRKNMWPQQEKSMWTYSETYNNCAFEFVEEKIGRPGNVATRSDAPVEGKVPWMYPRARSPADFKTLTRDVSDYRKWELREIPWAENEWHGMAIGAERRKPINAKKIFDIEKIPHLREHSDKPFDASMMERRIRDFGPKSMFETVHEAGDAYEEAILELNKVAREDADMAVVGAPWMKVWNRDYTRNGVTDTDRCEQILKDEPTYRGLRFDQKFIPQGLRWRYGKHKILDEVVVPPPSSMRIAETWDETAPQVEYEARMRANDSDAPYNVRTNLYISRHTDKNLPGFNPTLFTKRAFHVGTLGPAPWRHSAKTFDKTKTVKLKDASCAIKGTRYDYGKRYASEKDFER